MENIKKVAAAWGCDVADVIRRSVKDLLARDEVKKILV